MMDWKSNAQWPEGTILGTSDNVTTDTHGTEEQAAAVCRALEREGFGGDGEVFPVRTWVEQVPNAQAQNFGAKNGNDSTPDTEKEMV